MRPLLWLALLGLALVFSRNVRADDSPTTARGARVFLQPDRIRYDHQCLTIDGHDTFIYSGAFHYFRCPKELWASRLDRIRDAGFNCVETYVAWNWCERQQPAGLDDFSHIDLAGLDEFLTLAEQHGLYVLVRPGPYICAEWDTGGFPQWLLNEKPAHPLRSKFWLRTDDPVFLDWERHWFRAVCPVIARHQITRKAPGEPGVILVQLENEYDFVPIADDVKLNQVKALGLAARAAGIEVPFITCWTHQVRGSTDPFFRQVFDCCNFYPRWGVDGTQKDMDKLRREQPDAPMGTTELQGGWFAQVGGVLSEQQEGITGAQINNLTLFTIQNGETMLNYYMLYGGTNPDDWTARDLPTTYDYNAPIREWGGVGERYDRVWSLGHMLREHGARLARAELIPTTATGLPKDVTVVERRSPDGSRYLFVRTSQHNEPRSGTVQIRESGGPILSFDIQLEPFGSKVLYLAPGVTDAAQGEWLPKPAPSRVHPTNVPAPQIVSSALVRNDYGPGETGWSTVAPGEPLVRSGNFDNHFRFYQAQLNAATATNLWLNYTEGDAVTVSVNGQPATVVDKLPGGVIVSLVAGDNTVRVLYENHGHPNFGDGLEQPSGLLGAHLSGRLSDDMPAFTPWRMQRVAEAKKHTEVQEKFDDSHWATLAADKLDGNQLEPGQTAVFRSSFELPSNAQPGSESKWMLEVSRIDDEGTVYINGKSVGKANDWSHTFLFDVSRALRPGRNVVAVLVHNREGTGGLGLVTVKRQQISVAVPFSQLARPVGDSQVWWASDLTDTTGWQKVSVGGSEGSVSAGAGLTWYRLKFTVPPVEAGVWVPWRAQVRAAGNGFLYLNGQPLGRYWQVGPQHDFYLPECWLNTAPGAVNELTVCLRPTERGAHLEQVAIAPYEQFAEQR